jgi:hypothetical protein
MILPLLKSDVIRHLYFFDDIKFILPSQIHIIMTLNAVFYLKSSERNVKNDKDKESRKTVR